MSILHRHGVVKESHLKQYNHVLEGQEQRDCPLALEQSPVLLFHRLTLISSFLLTLIADGLLLCLRTYIVRYLLRKAHFNILKCFITISSYMPNETKFIHLNFFFIPSDDWADKT